MFVRQGTLLAQSFNPKTLTLADEPFPIAERVESRAAPGTALAFSLRHRRAGVWHGQQATLALGLQMVWLDRQGKPVGTVGPPGNYRGLDLAPDGQHVAAHRHDSAGGQRFLVPRPIKTADAGPSPIAVVLNWAAGLKK